MRPVLKKIPEKLLLPYVKLDPTVIGSLRINFDSLCQYLMQYHARSFSVAEFEKMLRDQLNRKLLGKPITPEALEAICRYIDDLSVYLTVKRVKAKKGEVSSDDVKEFTHKNKDAYKEFLQKAKARSPREYEALKKKFHSRLDD